MEFQGFGSASYHIGELKLAQKVADATIRSLTLPARQQLEKLILVVSTHDATYSIKKYMKRNHTEQLHVLEDISACPTVVVPLGMNGGVAHVIMIVNRHIFDSTCEHELILSLETLNWLCTNDNGYAKVYMAVHFNIIQEKK